MQSMNSGPQSFDTNKGPATPTALDRKAEGAREDSSMRFREIDRKPNSTVVRNGLSGDDIPAKKMTYTKLSSEDVKKSGGIPTAFHHYHGQGFGKSLPESETFGNDSQPARD